MNRNSYPTYSSQTISTFVEFLSEAITRMNQSRQNGHLCFFSESIENYMTDKKKLTTAHITSKSLTDSDWESVAIVGKAIVDLGYDFNPSLPSLVDTNLFEILKDDEDDPIGNSYRLKAHNSASQAIEKILNEGMTFSDCAAGTALADTIAILELLKKQYGEQGGIAYFDTLFGSAEVETPEERRLLISPYGRMTFLEDPMNHKINPIGYFRYEYKNNSFGKKGNRELPLGSVAYFLNNPDYTQNHSRAGTYMGINAICIKRSKTKKKKLEEGFKVFGIDEILTEKNILEILKNKLAADPSQVALYLVIMTKKEKEFKDYLQRQGRRQADYIPQKMAQESLLIIPENVTYEEVLKKYPQWTKVPGFVSEAVSQLNEEHIVELSTLDVNVIASKIDKYVAAESKEALRCVKEKADLDSEFKNRFLKAFTEHKNTLFTKYENNLSNKNQQYQKLQDQKNELMNKNSLNPEETRRLGVINNLMFRLFSQHALDNDSENSSEKSSLPRDNDNSMG